MFENGILYINDYPTSKFVKCELPAYDKNFQVNVCGNRKIYIMVYYWYR